MTTLELRTLNDKHFAVPGGLSWQTDSIRLKRFPSKTKLAHFQLHLASR